MTKRYSLIQDTKGDAVVEATILFPIIIMIFAALVLLAMYLPTRAALQRATQYAATAIAAEKSDTWLFFDEGSMTYHWKDSKDELKNVYVALINAIVSNGSDADKAQTIVEKKEQNILKLSPDDLTVEYSITNYVVYKEICVTATRIIPMPVDLSFVRFPNEIPITVKSTAIVQNGDEFVRNVDIAVDFLKYLDNKYNISEVFDGVKEVGALFKSALGW